jgi:hypothetical protein
MYVPEQSLSEPASQTVFCHLTGESYVWVDVVPPELESVALHYLPTRFYQQRYRIVRTALGGLKQIKVPLTPDPVPRKTSPQLEKLAEPDYSI